MALLKRILDGLLNRKPSSGGEMSGDTGGNPLSADLEANHQEVKQIFGDASDLLIKEFLLGGRGSWRVSIVYLESLADEAMIQTSIIEPLMIWSRPGFVGGLSKKDLLEQVVDRLMTAQEIKKVASMDDVVRHLLEGDTALMVDGVQGGLVIETKGWPQEQPQEPSVEQTTRGGPA